MIQHKTFLLATIFLLTAVFPVVAQINPDVEQRGIPVRSTEEIQGDWTCVFVQRMVAAEVIQSDKHVHNLRIAGDTVSYFEYPCAYYTTKVFGKDSLDSTDLSLNNVTFLNDTLVFFSNEVETNGYRFYIRDSFDQKIVDALVRDTFYLPSKFGKWYLQTQNCVDYTGEPPFRVKYPVNMPRIYKLDKAFVVNKNTILVKVNGKQRKFKVVECSIIEGYIVLEPFGWQPSNFRVTYFDEFKATDPCGNAIIYR